MTASSSLLKESLENVRATLGKHVKLGLKRIVLLETRPEKTEERFLVMSAYRCYLLTTKPPSRLESSFHFLDISSIVSKTSEQVCFTVDTKTYKVGSLSSGRDDIDSIIGHISSSLKHTFPHLATEQLVKTVELQPESRRVAMATKLASIEASDSGPCGGFSQMYRCMCDYYSMETREEVVWDIDTIYLSHNCKELRLKDFDHLRTRDLIPIVSALTHNTWFTRFTATHLKLVIEKSKNADAATELVKVMEKNCVLEELRLSSSGLRFDFVQKLCAALGSNSASPVAYIDLSHNLIEDRGAILLAASLNKLPKGVVHLDLTNTGLTHKGLCKLTDVIHGKQLLQDSLKTLILANNGVKGEDVTSVYTMLAQPMSLTHLDLSATDIPLDMMSGAMVRGCCHTVTHLSLSNNPFTTKKSKEIAVPKSWKQLFTSFYALHNVKLSSCKLPPDAVKDMLIGISDNSNIHDLDLDISCNDLRSAGAKTLESCLPTLKNISSLNISDNGFDSDLIPVLVALEKNTHIHRLSLGQNFTGIKSRNLCDVLDVLVHLIQTDECALEYLSLCDSKLRTDTALIINSLSSNSSITNIDITGNLMGNFGARMLSKTLQSNKTLHTVSADRNNITAYGYDDIATALQQNYTLKQFPLPVSDLVNAMKLDAPRTQSAIHKIETCLQRNHAPRQFTTESEYRLHQLFLVTPLQNIIGKLVVQIQNMLKKLDNSKDVQSDIETATTLIKESDSCRQLLPSLQKVASKSQDGDPVRMKLDAFVTDLQATLKSHIKETAKDMLETAREHCGTVMTSERLEEVEAECHDKNEIEDAFIDDLIHDVKLALTNKISEVNLSVAAHISDFVTDQLIDALKTSHTTLGYRLKQGEIATNLRKDISISIDSLDSQEEAPKRRSDLQRRKRPPSVFVHDVDEIVANNNHSLSHQQTSANAVSDRVDSALSWDDEFGELPSIPSGGTSLTHLVKSRPRRPKVHSTHRPMMKPLNLVGDAEINGEASDVERASFEGGNSNAACDRDNSFTESDESVEQRKEKNKPRTAVPKVGGSLSQGISNFFGRKKSTGTKPEPIATTATKTSPTPSHTSELSKAESPTISRRTKVSKTTSKVSNDSKSDEIKISEVTRDDDVSEETAKTADTKNEVSEQKSLEKDTPPKVALRPQKMIPKMGFGNDIMSQLRSRQNEMLERKSNETNEANSSGEKGKIDKEKKNAEKSEDKKSEVKKSETQRNSLEERKSDDRRSDVPQVSPKPTRRLKHDAAALSHQNPEPSSNPETTDDSQNKLTRPTPPLRPAKLSPKPLVQLRPSSRAYDSSDGSSNLAAPANDPNKRLSVQERIKKMDDDKRVRDSKGDNAESVEAKVEDTSPVAPVRRRYTKTKGDNSATSPSYTESPSGTNEAKVSNVSRLSSRLSATSAMMDSQSECRDSAIGQSDNAKDSVLTKRKSFNKDASDAKAEVDDKKDATNEDTSAKVVAPLAAEDEEIIFI